MQESFYHTRDSLFILYFIFIFMKESFYHTHTHALRRVFVGALVNALVSAMVCFSSVPAIGVRINVCARFAVV
jgi:hypothetical protein